MVLDDILHALQAVSVRIHKQVRSLVFIAEQISDKSVMSGVTHCRISCNVSSAHPGDTVELPPQLTPLQEADTEEQHQLSVEAQQKQVRSASNAQLSCLDLLPMQVSPASVGCK